MRLSVRPAAPENVWHMGPGPAAHAMVTVGGHTIRKMGLRTLNVRGGPGVGCCIGGQWGRPCRGGAAGPPSPGLFLEHPPPSPGGRMARQPGVAGALLEATSRSCSTVPVLPRVCGAARGRLPRTWGLALQCTGTAAMCPRAGPLRRLERGQSTGGPVRAVLRPLLDEGLT